VPGFQEKLNGFLREPHGLRNDAEIQWASTCAELGAVCLLGRELSLRILRFDACSPRRSRPESNCDIVACLNGQATFFEVKRNSKEVAQSLPARLQEALDTYECPYSLTGELHDRRYDCSNLPELLTAIGEYLDMFHEWKQENIVADHRPPPFTSGGVSVHFLKKPSCGSFFEPTSRADLRSYLLESEHPGKDGKKIPKVREAQEKGAHYLMVQVPSWEGLPTLAGGCFGNLKPASETTERTYWSEDERLGSLSGLVLFSRYDNFIVINNSNSGELNWLVA
jgi:hypothetical protein